ncbi:hypothetical protein WA158_000400 [Blastocystis sp. Blastoise]
MRFFSQLIIFCLLLFSFVEASNWAVLLSAFDKYKNYSITSVVCRAYAILRRNGFDKDHIIYMSFTDNFDSEENPFPGKIFTSPSEGEGEDFAAECRDFIDYKDKDVTAQIYMNILTNNAAAVTKATGIENPKVLNSTENDNVFLYYMDHGSSGSVSVGKTELTKEQMFSTINKMWYSNMYKKLVIYFEACYSGSMFDTFPENRDVFIMTSADSRHFANMASCPPYDSVNGTHLYTCLSGVFDDAWENLITNEGSEKTLEDVYNSIYATVSNVSDQNPQLFGCVDRMKNELLSDFIGHINITKTSIQRKNSNLQGIVPVSDVPVHLLKWKLIRQNINTNSLIEKQKKIEDEYYKEIIQRIHQDIYIKRLLVSLFSEYIVDIAMNYTLSSDITCVQQISQIIHKTCNYEYPFTQEHINALHYICQFSSISQIQIYFEEQC